MQKDIYPVSKDKAEIDQARYQTSAYGPHMHVYIHTMCAHIHTITHMHMQITNLNYDQ